MGAGFSDRDTAAMTAALDAARQGHRGANPLVGAAIVTADGQTVTGFHAGAGALHAEADAIAKAQRLGVDLTSSTLYVTLEPCSHYGRTGPCTQAIRDAGIPEVVFALPDSHDVAAGGGAVLAEVGVRVRSGLCRQESAALNARWRVAVNAARPFVTAKIAQSLDGRAAAADGTSQWITSRESREHAHLLRSRVGAVIVGTGTASSDNPKLTARDSHGRLLGTQPLPVVIGVSSLPPGSHLARNPGTLHVRTRDVRAALAELHAQGIQHVLVEGGPTLLGSFFAAGVVDEIFCYQAPMILGPGRPSLEGLNISSLSESIGLVPDDTAQPAVSQLGPDVLMHFAPAPGSAQSPSDFTI